MLCGSIFIRDTKFINSKHMSYVQDQGEITLSLTHFQVNRAITKLRSKKKKLPLEVSWVQMRKKIFLSDF